MTSSYECPRCKKRKTAALGTPKCSCGAMMLNVTGHALYTYECPRDHTRKRASTGTPKCSCGAMMLKVN